MRGKNENQKMALEELIAYNQKFIPGMKTLIKELRGIQLNDTRELLSLVIKGLNWEIEVFNGCEKLVNRKNKFTDKAEMSAAVATLGEVLKSDDYRAIANCLEEKFLPFVESFHGAAMEYLAANR